MRFRTGQRARTQRLAEGRPDPLPGRVLEILHDQGPAEFDLLLRVTGLPKARLQAALSQLELDGQAVRNSTQWRPARPR